MAIDINTTFTNTDGNPFPDTVAINASGPTATDGTEFVKVMVDNFLFGPQQALLNYAGLIPDGVPEEDGASQELEALVSSFGHPGEAVDWYGDADPGTLGAKILLLTGQGILIANYQALTDAVYVGDGNNATAIAFYKADDAAGTIRNTAGVYLILPDASDVYPRFQAESIYSSQISNNGAVAALVSQSETFIQSVTRVGLGNVSVVFTPGFFTLAPAITCTMSENSLGSGMYLDNITAAGVTVYCSRDGVGETDNNLNFFAQRQDADYQVYPADFLRGGIRY